MAIVGINFGSATSGTGFDVASTVSSIMASMRLPETTWTNRTAALQSQDAALSTLGSALSALSTSLAALTSFDGALTQKQGAVSDTSVAVLTAATSTAGAGTHTLTVQALATASAQHSSVVAQGATLNGSFTFHAGSRATHTVTFNATNNTLAGLAAAINDLDAGVSASVITDSNGSRLSLLGAAGAANAVTIDSSGVTDSGGHALTFITTQTAGDASYTLDGIPLTSASNTVSNALSGVTIQLLGPSTKDVTLQIANDTAAFTATVSNFVTSYNTLATALAAQEKKNSSGSAEPLFGDQTLSLLQSQLSTAFAFATANTGKTSNLAQLGIAVGTDGQLKLDAGALATALSSNFTGVTNFFLNGGDFGQNLTKVVSGLGTVGNGALALRTTQNQAEEQTLADNKSKLESRLTTYQAALTAKLNIANQILQAIPQQLNQNDQIYAAITGYGNK